MLVLFDPASVGTYAAALAEIEPRMSVVQRAMLCAQYAAPERTVTALQLAAAVGYTGTSANLHYGRLGRLVAEVLSRAPRDSSDRYPNWWAVLSIGASSPGGFLWIMHAQLAAALEVLGWVEPADAALPEEVAEPEPLREGAVRQITVNAYERNPEARRRCVAHYGALCYVCGFDFERRYGVTGRGYIHVHHEVPLSAVGAEYEVDPVADLKPVCPNCHAIIHRRTPPHTVEEVREMMRAVRP